MAINISLMEIWFLLPLIVLFLFSCIPLTMKVMSQNRERSEVVTLVTALLGIGLTIALACFNWMKDARVEVLQGALVFDGISSWSSIAILLILAATLVFSRKSAATRGNQFSEHTFLLMNAALGMIVLVCSNDLIITFIGMELMSLALYVLIGISHEQTLAKEAAFKYFIIGSLGGAFFLFGVALIYGGAGSTSFSTLMEQAPGLIVSNRLFLLGVLMVLSGIMFKVAIFPFHAWVPDVYQGSPTSVTGFMATGVKLSMFVVFIRFMVSKGLVGANEAVVALQWLAVLTMFVGNLAALRQNNLKRVLAYSGIAHSGYVLVGVIALSISQQSAGLATAGVLFYLINYAVMNIGAFGMLSLLEKDENHQLTFDDLRGLASRRPGFAIAFTIIMLSLAGIPPTAGFFGKFYIFSAAVNEGLYWLTVWGVVNSVISVYYYLRPVVTMYMQEPNGVPYTPPRSYSGPFILATTSILVVIAGLFSGPVLRAIFLSVRSLFPGA